MQIVGVLRHDLKLTKKKLEERAREAVCRERKEFFQIFNPFYLYPEKLVFVGESSKDVRDAQISMA
jgi:hypothetical protein